MGELGCILSSWVGEAIPPTDRADPGQTEESEMKGHGEIRFSELFADTVRVHGADWAEWWYTEGGMEAWEFQFWMRTL